MGQTYDAGLLSMRHSMQHPLQYTLKYTVTRTTIRTATRTATHTCYRMVQTDDIGLLSMRLLCMRRALQDISHAAFTCVTYLTHECHIYVSRDAFTCVTCLIHSCDMLVCYRYMNHDASSCQHTHTCADTKRENKRVKTS